jgi:hypothetical protein
MSKGRGKSKSKSTFNGPQAPALSVREPLRTWAGQGTGRLCTLCGRPIEAHQIEYEVELTAGRRLRFHFTCQQDWEEQAESRALSQSTASP